MVRREAETPPREVPSVRIFVSSPGDVAEERTLARQFINSELPKLPPFRGKLMFELIAWDDPAARIPMLASETPQESVNAARSRPAACDIVIVILWSRMGTPLPDILRKPNGERYLSGTEWEYEDAINSPQRPRPEVLVYRRMEIPKIALDDPGYNDKRVQFHSVETFFARFRNADGSLKVGVNQYQTPAEFKTLLSQDVENILYRRLQPSTDIATTPQAFAKIPREYIAWLRRNFEIVELFEAKESHAITLHDVYVPVLTLSAKSLSGNITFDCIVFAA